MVFVPVTLHQLLSSLFTFFQVSAATTDHVLIQGFNCSNEGEDWPKGQKGLEPWSFLTNVCGNVFLHRVRTSAYADFLVSNAVYLV